MKNEKWGNRWKKEGLLKLVEKFEGILICISYVLNIMRVRVSILSLVDF